MKYRFIDSIRGIAILMVILVHTSQSLVLPDGWVFYMSQYGQMGVQLFFVASAYTLCLSFDSRKEEPYRIRKFYIRRFFRIAPIYYIGIVGYFGYRILLEFIKSGHVIIPEQYTFFTVMANFLFLHGVYPPAVSVVPGGWSIGTEMLFYLIFPFIITPLLNLMKTKALAIFIPFLVAISSVVTIVCIDFQPNDVDFIYFSLLNQSSVFVVGISLYSIHRFHPDLISKVSILNIVILATSLTATSIYIGFITPIANSFTMIPFISALSFVFIIEIFKRVNILNFSLLQKIGQYSYSMYIIHFVFALQVSGMLNKHILVNTFGDYIALIISYAITVSATYFLAKISTKHIESYFVNKGKNVINKISSGSTQKAINTVD